jgi:hypothetical protein
MILDEHVFSRNGHLLVALGHVITPTLRARLAKFAVSPEGLREPICVRLVAVEREHAGEIDVAATAML